MRLRAIVLPLLAVGLVSGCWSSPEPPGETFVGMRLADGSPVFWAGRTCAGVSSLEVETTSAGASGSQTWTMTAQDGTGSFESVVLGASAPGFTSADAVPDWSEVDTVTVAVLSPDGPYSRSTWSLAELAGEGAGADGRWFTTLDRWVGEEDVAGLADEGIHPALCGDAGGS